MTHQPSKSRTKERITNGVSDLAPVIDEPSSWLSQALSVPRSEGYVDSNGAQIHYFEWGDKSKPGLLLLHGFLAHSRCFSFIAPFLAEQYHVVAYDLSGMGDSDAREDYPDDLRAAEAIDVAEHTGLFEHESKPTLITHSYGGIVAINVVNAHPDKFAGLTICDLMVIRPEILKEQAGKFRRPGNQDRDRPNRVYPDLATAMERFVLAPPQKVEQPELQDFMAYHSLKQVEGGWTWKFSPSVYPKDDDANARWSKVGHNIVALPGKVAIIYGAESLLFTPDSENYIREIGGDTIPIIQIPHARHHLMLDQPIAFVSALRSVLAMWA